MIPDFVSDLRKAVGPDCLLWLPGVVGVVLDDHGRVLLQRRSAAGLWTPLSGILEPGEAPAAGVAREVAEETGVRVVVERLAAVTASPPVRHGNGDRAQYLELVFACRPTHPGQSPRVCDDESVDVGWFPLNALPPMSERMREIIALVEKDEPQAWFAPAP
ncbi:NUDIX domain-containing protein [Streptomyces sp. NBC_00424]|uniref:NUDIX hydrolase n=1 Tax=Streptomyces sp. NBC_00424 TaxID=2903648 RepID=UPI002254133E|nr:NUDIX domain-containing protein [Streptomyces sp. NBC_00424]MCX5078966.1 NUDIX domain-containing protein [Streptomyces sp. NBC_00424]